MLNYIKRFFKSLGKYNNLVIDYEVLKQEKEELEKSMMNKTFQVYLESLSNAKEAKELRRINRNLRLKNKELKEIIRNDK